MREVDEKLTINKLGPKLFQLPAYQQAVVFSNLYQTKLTLYKYTGKLAYWFPCLQRNVENKHEYDW